MPRFLRSPATLIALLLGLAGVGLVLYAWRLPPFTSSVEMTENAYVRGQVTTLAPQVAGHVAEVLVQDYQTVTAGDLLVRIDDRTAREKVTQAEAGLAAQEAALASWDQDKRSAEVSITAAAAQVTAAQAAFDAADAAWKRVASLLDRGVATRSDADASRSSLESARAALGQATANVDVARQKLASVVTSRRSLAAGVADAGATLELARIDLGNTRIVAPVDGRLGEVTARVGQYLAAGTQVATLVPATIWVVANFKETQVARMAIGQPVTMTVDALGDAPLRGHIERFSPATGSEFSVIRADNATGNFTKVAQRLTVRVAIDPGQAIAARLAPGLSVVARVDTRAAAEAPTAAPAGVAAGS